MKWHLRHGGFGDADDCGWYTRGISARWHSLTVICIITRIVWLNLLGYPWIFWPVFGLGIIAFQAVGFTKQGNAEAKKIGN